MSAATRTIINDVQAPRWLGYTRGKAHAFLIPAGELPTGTLRAVCPGTFNTTRLETKTTGKCKLCTTTLADDPRKRSTGLSETSTDNVATGAQHGQPRASEARRAAEILEISGDAIVTNQEITENLRAGNTTTAMDTARELDARGPAAPVPHADRTPLGQRDHGTLDGIAMVQGPNTPPIQPTWRNPKTGETEPAAAYLGGSLKERPDREASTVPMIGGRYGYLTQDQYNALTRTQQRKYWTKIKKMNDYATNQRRNHTPRSHVGMDSGTGGTGTRTFADKDSRETERLMQQPPR